MKSTNSNQTKKAGFSPRDFLRSRRPELFSDTIQGEEPLVDRHQFEFYLDTLTSRKEELRFEHFCRRLAEKELCPNLIPQTGPTGGGDSKVDSETYPVAKAIAERWYIGSPDKSSSEKWGFAFSAKKAWTSKIKSDVANIAGTKRGYKVIYFITNQAVRDKSRAKYEDELSKKYKCNVRILDRTWIIEKVMTNRRWDVVTQTLDLKITQQPRPIVGPLDAFRLSEMEELDQLLDDPNRYATATYQLFEDSLQSALLARGLNQPRTDVDGKFARAERIAREKGSSAQLLRVLYAKAWTANFWFNDYLELDRLYDEIESLVAASQSVWDVDNLSNLWNAGSAWQESLTGQFDEQQWLKRKNTLREILVKHSADPERKTASLWARTQIALLDLVVARRKNQPLSNSIQELNKILKEVNGRLDYPADDIAQIVLELGEFIEDDEHYEELNELVINLQSQRLSEGEQGVMRLRRGMQLLNAGKKYAAIDQMAKAQLLLAKEERKEDFVRALVGTATAYEGGGLFWAARANLVFALDRKMFDLASGGTIDKIAIRLTRKLVWLELQLGRVPCVFAWLEILRLLSNAMELDEELKKEFEEEDRLIDVSLGILLLKTRFADLPYIGSSVALLERLSMVMSSIGLLFALGYEEQLRDELGQSNEELAEFVSKWVAQPVAKALPAAAEWHLNSTVNMRTALLGCKIEFRVENESSSIVFAETVIAFLESFFSTAVNMYGLYSMREQLVVELRQSEFACAPFENQVVEDDCGETKILVNRIKLSPSSLCTIDGYHDAFLDLLSRVLSELHVCSPIESLKDLFAKHRAQDRAFLIAQTPISLSNIFSKSPKYQLENWSEYLGEPLPLKRSEAWRLEQIDVEVKDQSRRKIEIRMKSPSEFDEDRLNHSDLAVMSPINLALWDRAGWCGVASLVWKDNLQIPDLILTFDDPEAPVKIFRGWQSRVGRVDEIDWIGVAIITGIDRNHPAHYRVAIGVNEEILKGIEHDKGIMASVFRMKDVTPESSENIERFIESYRATGCYQLSPGLRIPGEPMPRIASDLAIQKRYLRVVPAWQVGETDFLRTAMDGIDNPVIPPEDKNAPISELN